MPASRLWHTELQHLSIYVYRGLLPEAAPDQTQRITQVDHCVRNDGHYYVPACGQVLVAPDQRLPDLLAWSANGSCVWAAPKHTDVSTSITGARLGNAYTRHWRAMMHQKEQRLTSGQEDTCKGST
jgi:hypothetical protein